MRDFLEGIIDDNRQLVGMDAVGAADDETADLARDLLRLQTASLRGSYPDISLELTGAEGEIPLTGVPDLISQALDKLVSNAVEFSDEDNGVFSYEPSEFTASNWGHDAHSMEITKLFSIPVNGSSGQ